jgi:hypothetical protein
MEMDKNLQINLVSCLSERLWFVGTGMFFDLLPTRYLLTYLFHVKIQIQLFVT